MASRTFLPITAFCVLLAAVPIVLYCRDTEPSYHERSLAQWIKAYSHSSGDREAHDAIVCITTNSFPVLLRWAFANTTPRFQLINKFTFPLSQKPFLRPLFYRDNEVFHAALALRAFEIAGTNAASAVPSLATKITDANPELAIQAIYMSPLFGPTAVPAMRRAMTNQHPYIRCIAVGSFKRFGTNATEAIPDLVKALSDYDINVRENATNVLATLYPFALTNTPAK